MAECGRRPVFHRLGVWLSLVLCACSGGGSSSPDAGPVAEPVPVGWIHGLTLDAVDNLDAIVAAVGSLPRRAAVRIVFDENVPPSDYVEAVTRLSAVADIQGELLDSSAMATISRSDYVARTQAYLEAFGSQVSQWEIGNEINGDWLGAGAIDKAHDAFQMVEAAGGRSTLTLYYNAGCEDTNGPMLDWVHDHVPADMRAGLDQVTVSYYEDDCNGRVVPRNEWVSVFSELHTLFPSARLLMGEIGTESASAKAALMQRYYGEMRLPEVPAFAGGFFWWYGRQDFVPRGSRHWKILDSLWRDQPG
jgi:hypothetical protein